MEIQNKLTVSSSPHLSSKDTTTGIMLDVVIALLPALVASVIYFGFRALLVTAVAVASCVLAEYITRKILKRDNTISDLSAVVTGILLAFNLPVTIPLWIVVIGALVAIVVVKQFFGGIGQNFVNPALTARIVLMASFPTRMSTWTRPFEWLSPDAATTASPLYALGQAFTNGATSASEIKSTGVPSLLDMFLGQRAGSLGEVCAIALIIGGLYLIARRVISPIIPCCFIGTVAVITFIAGGGSLSFMLYHLMSGGLLLGAIFMATDYTTSPINTKGRIIFAIGCGVITSVIRLFGSLPEGVSFSIILMNILVPHIERMTTPKPFGWEEEKAK